MDLKKLKKLEGITWDLDGCLYEFQQHQVDEFIAGVGVIMARLLNGQITEQEAAALAHESFRKHGSAAHDFEVIHGVTIGQWFDEVHEMFDEKALTFDATLKDRFNQLPGMSHVLNTQSSMSWGGRVLAHIGVREFFKAIIDYAAANFQSKEEFSRSHELAVAAHGKPVDVLAMVEDKKTNLVIPKDMGKTTLLIHYGRALENPPSYIDFQFATPRNALDAIIYAKNFG
ncbi:MAG: hypothetical protein GC136_04545 [Alphaproteobacteria bacterium]|nr:hypothetical protein [Alphaproteobacteria bacterium]